MYVAIVRQTLSSSNARFALPTLKYMTEIIFRTLVITTSSHFQLGILAYAI